MASEQQKRAMKAYHLRKKIRDQKYVSEEEREWLAAYEHRNDARKAQSLPAIEAPANDANTSDANLPPLDVPLPESENAESTKQTNSNGSKTGETEVKAEVVDGDKKDTSEGAKQAGQKYADLYCLWLKKVSAECDAMGGYGLPAELIDSVVHFAAEGTFARLAERMGGTMSETGQDLTVVVSGGGMALQRYMLKQRRAAQSTQAPKNGKPEAQSQESADEAQPRPLRQIKPARDIQPSIQSKGSFE